jgi:hypothetical protein
LSLNWSGIELAILLRKRLEELTQSSTDRRKSPEERFNAILREYFKHIPIDITFTFNGRQYQMPLFMYVLRHTIWRPREVLLYYAQIITVSEDLRKKHGYEVTSEVIRRIVKDVTHDIINSEFINEFESTVTNIRDIILAFYKQNQTLSYETVSQIVQGLDFKFASGSQKCETINDKIEFLYRIGFLGVLADEQMFAQMHLQLRHAFHFNEGEAPIRGFGGVERELTGYRFLVHPMFSEYLEINTSQNELILQFSWQYLHEREVMLFASH